MEEHFRKLERMLLREPINAAHPDLHVEVGEGRCALRVPVTENMVHAARAAHGAMIFKALDDAATGAASSLVTDVLVVTSQFNVYFLRPAPLGDVLHATAEVTHQSRRLIIAEAEARSEEGKVVARGSATFMQTSVSLSPEIGYE